MATKIYGILDPGFIAVLSRLCQVHSRRFKAGVLDPDKRHSLSKTVRVLGILSDLSDLSALKTLQRRASKISQDLQVFLM